MATKKPKPRGGARSITVPRAIPVARKTSKRRDNIRKPRSGRISYELQSEGITVPSPQNRIPITVPVIVHYVRTPPHYNVPRLPLAAALVQVPPKSPQSRRQGMKSMSLMESKKPTTFRSHQVGSYTKPPMRMLLLKRCFDRIPMEMITLFPLVKVGTESGPLIVLGA